MKPTTFAGVVIVVGSALAGIAGLMAVVWPLLITVVFLPLAARKYQRLSH